MEHCLGVEVQPEGYMELWRRILFLTYAIVSYVYRWVVTFSILYFFHNFLRPYKLEVISDMLVVAAVGSMVGWPLWRMGKNLYRRGRLPDMKPWRVAATTSVALAIIAFLCFVPVPISRIRGVGLVQAHPDSLGLVVVRRSGYLQELKANPGDEVRKGMPLAIFRDPELEDQLASARTDYENHKAHLKLVEEQKDLANSDPKEMGKIEEELTKVTGDRDLAKAEVDSLEQIKAHELVLVAPCDGVVGQGPRVDDVGKYFEAAREQNQQNQSPALFTIIDPVAPRGSGQLRVCLPVPTPDFNRLRENLLAVEADRVQNGKDNPLYVTLRVHGRDSTTWTGRIARLDESEARTIPLALSNRANGPVAVKAGGKGNTLVPQTQHYLVYIDIIDPDTAIEVGATAQVKVHCRSEPCVVWAWRKINDMFNLRLM
jgi:putative peptide zinc metalloprotease protein